MYQLAPVVPSKSASSGSTTTTTTTTTSSSTSTTITVRRNSTTSATSVSTYNPSQPPSSTCDPLTLALLPSPSETPDQRAARQLAEQKAKKRSDEIDRYLKSEWDSPERKRIANAVKVLLLGQSESGKSTALKNFELLYNPQSFQAEREAWRLVILFNLIQSIRILHNLISDAITVQQQKQDQEDPLSPRSPFYKSPATSTSPSSSYNLFDPRSSSLATSISSPIGRSLSISYTQSGKRPPTAPSPSARPEYQSLHKRRSADVLFEKEEEYESRGIVSQSNTNNANAAAGNNVGPIGTVAGSMNQNHQGGGGTGSRPKSANSIVHRATSITSALVSAATSAPINGNVTNATTTSTTSPGVISGPASSPSSSSASASIKPKHVSQDSYHGHTNVNNSNGNLLPPPSAASASLHHRGTPKDGTGSLSLSSGRSIRTVPSNATSLSLAGSVSSSGHENSGGGGGGGGAAVQAAGEEDKKKAKKGLKVVVNLAKTRSASPKRRPASSRRSREGQGQGGGGNNNGGRDTEDEATGVDGDEEEDTRSPSSPTSRSARRLLMERRDAAPALVPVRGATPTAPVPIGNHSPPSGIPGMEMLHRTSRTVSSHSKQSENERRPASSALIPSPSHGSYSSMSPQSDGASPFSPYTNNNNKETSTMATTTSSSSGPTGTSSSNPLSPAMISALANMDSEFTSHHKLLLMRLKPLLALELTLLRRLTISTEDETQYDILDAALRKSESKDGGPTSNVAAAAAGGASESKRSGSLGRKAGATLASDTGASSSTRLSPIVSSGSSSGSTPALNTTLGVTGPSLMNVIGSGDQSYVSGYEIGEEASKLEWNAAARHAAAVRASKKGSSLSKEKEKEKSKGGKEKGLMGRPRARSSVDIQHLVPQCSAPFPDFPLDSEVKSRREDAGYSKEQVDALPPNAIQIQTTTTTTTGSYTLRGDTRRFTIHPSTSASSLDDSIRALRDINRNNHEFFVRSTTDWKERLRKWRAPREPATDSSTDQSGTNDEKNEQENAQKSTSGWKAKKNKWASGLARTGTDGSDDGRWNPWDEEDDPAHFIQACAQDLNSLWSDPVVQEYLGKSKFKMEHSPGFFLADVDRIVSREYVPTDDDILRARLKTIGVTEHHFSIGSKSGKSPHSLSATTGGIPREWIVYDVGGSRTQRAAWLPYFDTSDAIIFIASLSAFDQTLTEDPTLNRMEDSLRMFRDLVSSPVLKDVNIVLFLNKVDLLDSKLKSGIQLAHYFKRYGDRPNETEAVKAYFRAKFTAIYRKFTPPHSKRIFAIHTTSLTDPGRTRVILQVVGETILSAHIKNSVA